ncbi:MAG: PAS domain S-box protein [Actinobacteria bacterium]|nr:MAG: PAS domain S-box protein [Actinomycetota bacterium]
MTVTTAAPELLAKWFRSHGWLVALIGLVLAAAVTVPFALVDVSAPETSAALALLIAAAVAFAAGPRWGALVAAGGWALFYAFVVDHAARAFIALPVWLAVAILAGLASDHLRRTERERRRDASELDAVKGDATQAIVGLDLDGKILSWDRGAERIYGHSPEDVAGSDVKLLGSEEDAAHVLAGLERVAKGERVDRSHLRQRGRNGEELVVSMSLAPVRDDSEIVAACARRRTTGARSRTRAPRSNGCSGTPRPSGRRTLSSSPSSCTPTTRTTSSPAGSASRAAPRPGRVNIGCSRAGAGSSGCARRSRPFAGPRGSRSTRRRCSSTSASASGPTRSASGCWRPNARRRPGRWSANGASTSCARRARCSGRRPTIEALSRGWPSSPFATIPIGASSTWSRTEARSSESPSRGPSC